MKKNKFALIMITMMALFGCGVADKPSSESSTGSTEQGLCPVPNFSGTVGALPSALPNQIPPGHITAIIANGTSTLQVTYQTTSGTTQTLPVVSGDSQITFTGGWQKNGFLVSVVANGNVISFNNGQGSITVANATVSGSAAWSGTNGGVGKVTGSGANLQFAGYNANSGNLTIAISFTVCTNTTSVITTCTTNATCQNPSTAPAGADTSASICGSDGTCEWHVKNDYTYGIGGPVPFQCVVGIAHPCSTASILHGIKYCQVTATSGSTPTATGWGVCTSDFTTSGVKLPYEDLSCRSLVDCTSAIWPDGADGETVGCDSRVTNGTHYCVYVPAIPSSGFYGNPSDCLGGEFRRCTTSGGQSGIENCIGDPNTNSSHWSSCHT